MSEDVSIGHGDGVALAQAPLPSSRSKTLINRMSVLVLSQDVTHAYWEVIQPTAADIPHT